MTSDKILQAIRFIEQQTGESLAFQIISSDRNAIPGKLKGLRQFIASSDENVDVFIATRNCSRDRSPAGKLNCHLYEAR